MRPAHYGTDGPWGGGDGGVLQQPLIRDHRLWELREVPLRLVMITSDRQSKYMNIPLRNNYGVYLPLLNVQVIRLKNM